MPRRDRAPILVVEDSDEDFDVLQLLMASIGVEHPLKRCRDADEVHEALDRLGRPDAWPVGTASRLPALVLLDLNLPGTDGRVLLRELRADPRMESVPIVVFSTSANPRDIRNCYAAGANAYLIKPVGLDRLERMLRALSEFWLNAAVLPAEVEEAA